ERKVEGAAVGMHVAKLVAFKHMVPLLPTQQCEPTDAPGYPARPSCFACSAASQHAEMMISRSPSHLVVWPNSTSNALPVGAITLPSGRVSSPVKVPVALVTTVIQSPLPNWIGYGVFTCMSGKLLRNRCIAAECAFDPWIGSASPGMYATMSG